MQLSIRARHLPPRIAAGAFILNSGVGKLSADEEAAARLHGFAVGAYPWAWAGRRGGTGMRSRSWASTTSPPNAAAASPASRLSPSDPDS
jgi:hypothetical protein